MSAETSPHSPSPPAPPETPGASSTTQPQITRNVHTEGGGYVEGNVNTGGGDFAGRDIFKTINNFFSGGEREALERQRRNRQAMLELVKRTWVKGVLEKSLYAEVLIELGLEEHAGAVERPFDMQVQTPDQPNRPLPPGVKMLQVFDDMNRALLILGEPGAGKTTLLLELARDTIARAEADPTQRIPVVFNLSSWTDSKQSLADWLVEELNTKYHINKNIARPWVEQDDLLLLLDGLDEVRAENRAACVQAINAFRREHGLTPLAVCSRIADYEALASKLQLHGAVVVRPLTPKQIDAYFEKVGDGLATVRHAWRHDAALQELAQSPLMLSILTLAYRNAAVETLQLGGSIEASRKHLFDTYIQQMFKRRGTEQRYGSEQTMRWLTWLAQRMVASGQTIFLLERIHHSWLQTRAQSLLYCIMMSSPMGLLGGLFGGLLLGLHGGLLDGLLGGLFGGLLGGLLMLSRLGDSKLAEFLKWSWKKAGRGLLAGLLSGLLLVGLLGGLGLLVRLPGGLPGGLLLGLVFGLLFGLFSGLTIAEIEVRTTPNQGIHQSIKNAVRIGLLFGLLGGLLFGLFGGLVGLLVSLRYGLLFGLFVGLLVGLLVGLFFGLLVGLLVGLLFGGSVSLSHYILRAIFYRSGYMPLDYVRFLDYVAERILLRKVGGGYVFTHRLLMEHFAGLGEFQTDEKRRNKAAL